MNEPICYDSEAQSWGCRAADGMPLVQPAEDGNILLVWREPADSLRVDVHLPSRQAEHRILHDLDPQGKGQHTLKGEGWKTLSRKVSEWKKSLTKQNSTG